MAEDSYAPRPVAGWYMVAAIASALFMIIGCRGYLLTVTADPQSLPIDQRAMLEAQPTWMIAAYGTAVWVGLAGTVMLVFRRKLAVPLLLLSLIAAAVTFLPYAVVPAVRDTITANDIAAAVIVLAITWTIFWFARHSQQRGWLR
jgi:hypothetical protein